MELYRTHGVNTAIDAYPCSSLPFPFAFYAMLGQAMKPRRASSLYPRSLGAVPTLTQVLRV